MGKEMVGTGGFCACGTCGAGLGHTEAQPPVLPFQVIPRCWNSAPYPRAGSWHGDGATPGGSLGSDPREDELQPERRMEMDSLPCIRDLGRLLAFPAVWGVIHQPLALLEPVLHVLPA